MNKTIYFITGPTCIGKSKFAINLSKIINGEIINADSMQIYKELKIISARPSSSDIKNVPHHLYGYIMGNERYNVEKWCNDASVKINLLHNNNLTLYKVYFILINKKLKKYKTKKQYIYS